MDRRAVTCRPRHLRAAGAAFALTLLLGACSSDTGSDSGTTSAAASPAASAPAIDDATLQSTVQEAAKQFIVPGAVVLLRTPEGEQTVTYGTTERDGGAPVTLDDH